ncbi:hypothetical protein BH20VER1_BH20VER1_00140 [soil metagenome]
MKKPSTHSAFFRPRAALAFSLCVIAALLAASAFTGFARTTPGETGTAARKSAKSPSAKKKNVKPAKADAARPVPQRLTGSKGATLSAPASPEGIPDRDTDTPGPAPRITETMNADGQTVYTVYPSGIDVSPPLTELALRPSPGGKVKDDNDRTPKKVLPFWRIPQSDVPDPVTQVVPQAAARGAAVTNATTGFNFLGVPGSGSWPPDANGAAGNDQYVETVNTRYQVWSLNRATNTATSIAGPSNINTLWSGFVGGNCAARNDGDPIVLYDKLANRWLISQFTSATSGGFYYQCVAVSTTANAAGTYHRYAFAVPNGHFGDYPHYGTWTDAYYMMAHAFTNTSGGYQGAHFAAMDRTKMLAGDPTATWQVIVDTTEGGHMPADLDGHAPPPHNAPGIFLSIHGSSMYLYRMKVDWANPANTTRPLQATMPIAPATAACGGTSCIPQPGSGTVLASLADRLMFRVAYRNFIDHESLVVSHSVNPNITGVVSGVRWYDFRISGAPDAVCSAFPCTYQQGTVADNPGGRSRWMPSIAMDGAENILVGYSATGTASGSDNHSIRYTGRAKTDPLGQMTVPERIVHTGTRNITTDRWGDYTSITPDPVDDCTFWYVNQYYETGNTGNANWRTRVNSSRFPDGNGAGQCQASPCTTRPASAPTGVTASPVANNQLQISWTAVAPAPGSYAIERAIGAPGSEGLYQPVGFVAGNQTNFIDTTVQGGVTYTYRVIAATDAGGRCQALVRSAAASATATGTCNLKPTFAGAVTAGSAGNQSCGVTINWAAGSTSCPLSPLIRYNIYRGTVPDFTPSAANRVASCVEGTSYTDTNNLTSGNTYYYVVRAEDNSTNSGGPCNGGNEESNSVVIPGTPYGAGTSATPGIWTDGGGDNNAFLHLNAGTSQMVWRFVKTADDPGANHTPGGAYAYRNTGPAANATYQANACSAAETPTLTVGATSVNLTYWERHQIEQGWDGVAVEYSRNGGAWTSVPAPNNLTANGCQLTDVITDWSTLSCTGAPPANACGSPANTPVITGPIASGTSCANWTTGALTAYGRRCHTLVGLTPGDTIKFRWRFISDPAAEFAGFYLDDIAITNILLPNSCDASLAPAMLGGESVMTHGGAGTFGVPLPIGSRGIEPRLGAGTGPGRSYTIVMHFDREVNGGTASVAGNGQVDSVSFSGDDMIIELSNVTDQQTITLTANNVTTPQGGMLAAASVQIGFLAGDVNDSSNVNATDISMVKSISGSTTTAANFRADVVVSGTINATDLSFVKSRSGTTLP